MVLDLIGLGFFFQAEDGIRDGTVTGVQTCALPIWLQLLTRAGCTLCAAAAATLGQIAAEAGLVPVEVDVDTDPDLQAEFGDRVPVVLLDGREHSYRSEERRVGKECRSRVSPYQ